MIVAKLFDWKNETWLSLGRFCGKQFPPTITTSGENMKILFRSNGNHQGDGFRVSLLFLVASQIQISDGLAFLVYNQMRWKVGCGGEFDAPTGQITSPNYPQRYGDNLMCNYTIRASEDTYIVAHFVDKFDIESHTLCVYDRLSAYQGNSSASPPIGRFCGSQPPAPIVSRSNLFLQFRTDGSISKSGFKLNYTTQGQGCWKNLVFCRHVNSISRIFYSECGGRISFPTIISSPSHPDTYYNNLNCTWRIEAPIDQVVDIK